MSTHVGKWVHIHYQRLPNRKEIFLQRLIHDGEHVKITLARDLIFDPPIMIHGTPVLETGSDAVWFTFPRRWHDIGRFHRADGTFTGFYANILTPPIFHHPRLWETTDLFLDVWLPQKGDPYILDRDQLQGAEDRGWIDPGSARRARMEARLILEQAQQGLWPPEVVRAWPLERARS